MTTAPIPTVTGASDPYAGHYARASRERALAVRAAFAAVARSVVRLFAAKAKARTA